MFRGGRGRGRGRKPLNRELFECYRCHKLGHFQYKCPAREKRATYAELEMEKEIPLVAQMEKN